MTAYNPEVKQAILGCFEKKQILSDLVRSMLKVTNSRTRYKTDRLIIAAIAELNKMDGDYSPIKTISGSIDVLKDEDIKPLLELQKKMLEDKQKEY